MLIYKWTARLQEYILWYVQWPPPPPPSTTSSLGNGCSTNKVCSTCFSLLLNLHSPHYKIPTSIENALSHSLTLMACCCYLTLTGLLTSNSARFYFHCLTLQITFLIVLWTRKLFRFVLFVLTGLIECFVCFCCFSLFLSFLFICSIGTNYSRHCHYVRIECGVCVSVCLYLNRNSRFRIIRQQNSIYSEYFTKIKL